MKKKILALVLASCMALSLAACGGKADEAAAPASEPETAAQDEADAADQAETEEPEQEEEQPTAVEGDVSVFYYTYGDTYISSVRSALDSALESAGIPYQDYDSNNSQTTQTEQVTTAIAKGTSLLVVNLVDSGSDDAAKNIIEQASAQNIPVIFFNRSVSEEVVSSYDKCVFVGTDYEMAGHMQGEMIGNYLMENFDTPYFARSISEFWHRWHISLSTWFRDYVYIPLGGNRRGKGRKYRNLLLTFAVSGLWHGAGWNFVVWGMLNGLYQVAGDLTGPLRARLQKKLHIHTDCGSYRLVQGVVTFLLVDFAWLFSGQRA